MDDYRVLLLAPTRPDREATLELLRRASIAVEACDGVAALATEADRSVGVVLLTDTALADPQIGLLTAALSRQPAWSDIPIVLLCRPAGLHHASQSVLAVLRNVTLLERPTSSRTLLSSVQAALRARARQYQLRDQFDALREADQRKDLFLATLAHELRNPLAPIRTAARILASPNLQASQLQWAQSVIQRQVGHMALLLDDLLDIARITQGKLALKMAYVTLREIVESAVEAARPLIDQKKHRLIITQPPGDVTINADALRLAQVISNLLNNAAKYTDTGGHIELSASVRDGVLCLGVRDDGIGIAAGALSRIFDMFSQVDDASSRSEGGLGIGLSLVKAILSLHGGTVEARSDGPGRGSEFIARLPLTTPESDHATVGAAPPPVSSGRRVMIADDNKDAADALAMLLELGDHEVRVAYGGHAAVTLAGSFRPDVAFIDIGMPDCSGYEVAQAIRRESWGAAMRLVALTGWGQDGDRQYAKDAGFDRHMTKPISSQAIETLLTESGPVAH